MQGEKIDATERQNSVADLQIRNHDHKTTSGKMSGRIEKTNAPGALFNAMDAQIT